MGGMAKRWAPLVGLAVMVAVALGASLARRIGPSHDAAAAAAAPAGSRPARSPAVRTSPLALPARPRVIVFSPHPDDETIGVGGLLARLARAQVPLRVVFMTNGDGYPRAVETDLDVKRPTDADYIAFGELRQREARNAVAHEEEAPGGKVRMTFRVVLPRQVAEALAARAIPEEKNIGTLVTEILEAAGQPK